MDGMMAEVFARSDRPRTETMAPLYFEFIRSNFDYTPQLTHRGPSPANDMQPVYKPSNIPSVLSSPPPTHSSSRPIRR